MGAKSEAFCFELLRAFELREPLSLARATCARTRFGSRVKGRTEVEPAASRTCRRDRRANQRTSREVATFFSFFFIWELNESGV